MKAYIVEYKDPDHFLKWITVYAENKNDVEDRFRTMMSLDFDYDTAEIYSMRIYSITEK